MDSYQEQESEGAEPSEGLLSIPLNGFPPSITVQIPRSVEELSIPLNGFVYYPIWPYLNNVRYLSIPLNGFE